MRIENDFAPPTPDAAVDATRSTGVDTDQNCPAAAPADDSAPYGAPAEDRGSQTGPESPKFGGYVGSGKTYYETSGGTGYKLVGRDWVKVS